MNSAPFDQAFNDHQATVQGRTFIYVDWHQLNTLEQLIKDQQTVDCQICHTRQYCGGQRMFRGTDAFTEKIEQQSRDECFSLD